MLGCCLLQAAAAVWAHARSSWIINHNKQDAEAQEPEGGGQAQPAHNLRTPAASVAQEARVPHTVGVLPEVPFGHPYPLGVSYEEGNERLARLERRKTELNEGVAQGESQKEGPGRARYSEERRRAAATLIQARARGQAARRKLALRVALVRAAVDFALFGCGGVCIRRAGDRCAGPDRLVWSTPKPSFWWMVRTDYAPKLLA